jgi:hypothetical protein
VCHGWIQLDGNAQLYLTPNSMSMNILHFECRISMSTKYQIPRITAATEP